MCFGGGKQKQADPVPAPAPAPTPVQPTEVEGTATQEERRLKLQRMRSGLASTIKTSAKGLTWSGSDLLQQTLTGKEKIGQ